MPRQNDEIILPVHEEDVYDIYNAAVKVVDANNNTPISGATVAFTIIYTDEGTNYQQAITDSNGQARYAEYKKFNKCTCTISKSGYTSQTVSVNVTINETNYQTIRLSPTQGDDEWDDEEPEFNRYVYKITVKNSSGNPIEGATINIYTKLGTIFVEIDPNVTKITNQNGIYTYTTNSDRKIWIIASKAGYQEMPYQYAEPSNFFTNVSITLTEISTNNYYYVIKVVDNHNNPIPGVIVDFYTSISYTTPWKKYKCSSCDRFYGGSSVPTTCSNCGGNQFVEQSVNNTTNTSGFITIEMGSHQSEPPKIYAKITSIPSTSNYESGTFSDVVNPTLYIDVVGCTFTLTRVTHYYYNYVFIDKYSGKPVSGVGFDGSTKTSDSNGKISLEYTSNANMIVFKKEGYENYTIKGNTNTNQNSYTIVNLEPSYSIRVNYNGNPYPGAVVKILYKPQNGQSNVYGYFTTYTNGYIDTLPPHVYTSGEYWVSVTNITINEIGRWIENGDTVINIIIENVPDDTEEPEDVEGLVKAAYGDFDEMSVKYIKDHIDSGNEDMENDNNVTYRSKGVVYNGGNDYRIKIINPDAINVYDIFSATPVEIYNNQKNIIGSMDIKLKSDLNELRVKTINRYSGYYNPIFKDILFYNNMTTKDGVKCPFSNTSFDYDYEDNYGRFGVIKNMWFHKVNTNKDVKIINTTEPYYPLTGQYALDCRDYNVFETNWDMKHYTKQVDVENSEVCRNISSMKDGLCMFGSKYLNVPNTIEIYGLTLGDDPSWTGEWNDDWINMPKSCPGEIMFKEVNNNSVDFYIFLKKRIIRFFQNKLKGEFEKYISSENTYDKKGVEDDIEEYVKKNILKLYRLDSIKVYIRRVKKGIHDSRIENDYGEYLEKDKIYFRQHGFIEVNNIRLSKINTDSFDRKLVYNLKPGMKEDFGFSFIIKKI